MEFGLLDYSAFIGYIVIVVAFAMYMSRREKSSEDYFLAGRQLTWWLIGISLIASNISTEHFVGMAGQGYSVGLAFASYEWSAAVAMVLVAIFLLPRFLRHGIYTIPEYLEHRYSSGARGLMALYMMVAYVFVIISAVLYAGAVGLDAIFGEAIRKYVATSGIQDRIDLPGLLGEQWLLVLAVWLIGIVAGVYTVWGGLKAVVWADLFNGLGLILGGILVTVLGFMALGGDQGIVQGVTTFFESAGDKLSVVKPFNHPLVPWVAVFIGGLWIPQFFYWGLNQFITQRALGARSVAEGQKGIVFAAGLKLLMPFIIIFPGIMAFELYAGQLDNPDKAYPHMIQTILRPGLRGLMLAALFGAVMSSLDSMLNSASTIFTMDLYKRHLKRDASDRSLIRLGRVMTAVFVVIACLWAPQLGRVGAGVFNYIQLTWGFITPAIVAVFFFGLVSKRTPSQAALGSLLLGPPIYMWCLFAMPNVAYLHHMAFTFVGLAGYMFLVTLLAPLRDVDESLATDTTGNDEAPTGLIRRTLVPFATVALGGYLMGVALHHYSWLTLTGNKIVPESAEWVHMVVAGVPVALYVCFALFVLRLPGPGTRLVPARGARARKASVGRGLWGLVKFAVIALAGIVVVGLHVYLFCAWIKPRELPDEYWQRSFTRTIPWVMVDEEIIPEGDPQGLMEPDMPGPGAMDPPVEAGMPGPGALGPPAEPGPPGPGALDPPVEDQLFAADPFGKEAAADDEVGEAGVAAEDPAEEEALRELPVRKVPLVLEIFVVPLAIAAGAVLVFLLGLVMVWRVPPTAEAKLAEPAKVDLTPSSAAKVLGVLVILATVVLYYLFF